MFRHDCCILLLSVSVIGNSEGRILLSVFLYCRPNLRLSYTLHTCSSISPCPPFVIDMDPFLNFPVESEWFPLLRSRLIIVFTCTQRLVVTGFTVVLFGHLVRFDLDDLKDVIFYFARVVSESSLPSSSTS